jgi:beta-phosphoglucomutase
MIEAFIFDFDGVILDSEPLHYEACCVALKNLGIKLDFHEYKNHYLGQTDKDMFPRLLADKGYSFASEQLTELIERKISAYDTIIKTHNQLPVLPDFELFLLKIAERTNKIAICSGSNRDVITFVLKQLGDGTIHSFFEIITSCEDVQFGKPSAEGYLLTAKKLGCSPESCFVIEDSPPGITAARSAGMRVAGLMTTYDEKQLSEAHLLAAGFSELLKQQDIFIN